MESRKKAEVRDDCKNPACKDISEMIKQGRLLGLKKWADSKRDMANSAPSKHKARAAAAAAAAAVNDGCPMDKGALGAATWGLMHTTAAHFPDEPSAEAQNHAKAFMGSLAALYPCTYCREDFKEEIEKEPPNVGSRLALSLWTCRQHNVVNEKLGKPTFECTLERLDERWKTGGASCWPDTDEL